ncbi:MAG: AMP-binding protein [Woeseiaceae bacterium]|nr:AMP-binding protein [Woeseiaceae bacterium]
MSTESISALISDKARRFGPKLALSMYGGDPAEAYTYSELDDAASRLSTGLARLGVNPGDRVAILSESRPRWGVAFFATTRAGAVVVPMDTRQTPRELAAILDDAKPKILLLSRSMEGVARELIAGREDLLVFSIEPVHADTDFESIDRISADDVVPVVERNSDDIAVITYTSGTMGRSKGVATTYGNLLFEIRAFRKVMLNDSHVSSVSILPLSHLFELTAGFLGILYGGGSIRFCASLMPQDIAAAMRQQRITCMTAVPLFLKLLAAAIRREIDKQPRLKRVVCRAMAAVSPMLPMALRRRVFKPLRDRLGGQLEYFVCGGAPLDRATRRFFERIGIPVYEGYGLAETSPVIATNGPVTRRSGSVGKPLPGVEVRISAEGEILTRGPQVMRGYFGNPELTARIIDEDGWLHTGDLGFLDSRGFLHVTGRRKNTIVLGSGKKVQPEELEETLFEHPFIEEGCVVGVSAEKGIVSGSEEVCAVAVTTDAADRYCAEHAMELEQLVEQIVQARARRFSPSERPTRVVVRKEPLPRTSTRKVRRPDVCRWVSAQGVLA